MDGGRGGCGCEVQTDKVLELELKGTGPKTCAERNIMAIVSPYCAVAQGKVDHLPPTQMDTGG